MVMGKSGVGVFFLLGGVAVLRLLFVLPQTKPSVPVEPTAKCRLAIETLRQNRLGFVKMARDSFLNFFFFF